MPTLLDGLATLRSEKRRLLIQRLDPLSFIQERLWFLHQFAPGVTAYNIPLPVELAGPLDRASAERSLRTAVARHEILRTTFPCIHAPPVQHAAANGSATIPMIDSQALPPAARCNGRD